MRPSSRGSPEESGHDSGSRKRRRNWPTIPRYRLIEEVGSGGMSVVFRAFDQNLGREVAVKILHRHLAGKEEERGRFRREAEAVASLRHSNILEVYDYSGYDAEEAYIVSEFIHGPTLREFAQTVGLGLPEIGVMVAERLACALSHAHAGGIIHRDVKPENVMFQDDGSIKLTDFGIARMVDRDDRMTQTGALLGSPAHMPPEIIAGEPVDHRSDIFSLGTVLYWLACGTLPFTGDSPAQVLKRIVESDYRDPREIDPRVSDSLAETIHKSMSRKSEDRHASAEDLRDDLASYLDNHGFGGSQEELARFFEDPTSYKQEQKERLLELLFAKSREALLDGETAVAIRALDRVLAIKPGHEEAFKVLDDLRHRGVSPLAKALAAVSIMALVAFAWLVPWKLDEHPSESHPDPERQQDVTGHDEVAEEGDAAARDDTQEGLRAPSTEPREKRSGLEATKTAATVAPRDGQAPEETPTVEPTVPEGDARRPVRILVDTWADIAIDGETLQRDREARTDLSAGSYELSITREGFVPVNETLEVTPGEDKLELRHRLVPQPAAVRVINEQNAAVSVNDKLVGPATTGGFEIPVTFPELPDGRFEYPVGVTLRIEKPGYEEQEHQIELRPGQVEEIVVELEPET